ncbi:MAG: hypothetical protein DRZ90_05660 [Spirochaetes bacterium]|nr:MAG: hypothetical protein DRZ90_05660 [Spirochaetota bacterium]
MNIPVILLFNDTFTVPAGVCITSLLENASSDTFYTIYVLHSAKRLNKDSIERIRKLESVYSNCKIIFLDVEDQFTDSYKSGHLSIDSYYRLLIPSLFKEYDRVIYADVDIIFLTDLKDVFTTDLNGKALGAVVNLMKPRVIKGYPVFSADQYFNAGFLLMDLNEIRKITDYSELTEKLSREDFEFIDQDILNIIFRGNVKYLDKEYNFSRSLLKTASLRNIDIFRSPSVIHFVGRKPWDGYLSIHSDQWWYYYSRSIYYNPEYFMKYLDGYKQQEEMMLQYKVTKKLGMNSLFRLLRKIKRKIFVIRMKNHSHLL